MLSCFLQIYLMMEKLLRLKRAEAHLAQAKAEREHYRSQVDKCRETWKSLTDENQAAAPNSLKITIHQF